MTDIPFADISFDLSDNEVSKVFHGRLDRLVSDYDACPFEVFHLADPDDGHMEPFFVVSCAAMSMSSMSTLYEEFGYRDRRSFLESLRRRFPQANTATSLFSIRFHRCSGGSRDPGDEHFVPPSVRDIWYPKVRDDSDDTSHKEGM